MCVTRFAREELKSSVGIGDATAERIKVQTAKSMMKREDIFETDSEGCMKSGWVGVRGCVMRGSGGVGEGVEVEYRQRFEGPYLYEGGL